MPKILVVDDDEQIRGLLQHVLHADGHSVSTAEDAEEARRRLARNKYALMLVDVNMPRSSGLELISDTLPRFPQTAVLMMSGYDDPGLASMSLRIGAYDYIVKPFSPSELRIAIDAALHRRSTDLTKQTRLERLEVSVQSQRDQLAEAMEQLQRTDERVTLAFAEVLRRMSLLLDAHNADLGAHTDRSAMLAVDIAGRMGWTSEDQAMLCVAASLHDIGKIAVPADILHKPGPLTPAEFEQVKRHTEVGHRLLSGAGFALLDMAAEIALTHHERWDGSGYPGGLAGDDIPLVGRIVAVADVFDALTSDRPYRAAMSAADAAAVMRPEGGSQFDPEILDVFFASLDDEGRSTSP